MITLEGAVLSTTEPMFCEENLGASKLLFIHDL